MFDIDICDNCIFYGMCDMHPENYACKYSPTCEHCKYYKDGSLNKLCKCSLTGVTMKSDDFCSLGEMSDSDKEELMEFITKAKNFTGKKTCDVCITAPKGYTKDKLAIRFGLFNGGFKAFSDERYMVISNPVGTNRIYFKPVSVSESGFSIIRQTYARVATSAYFVVTQNPEALKEMEKNWIGEYVLRYDEIEKMHYIEKNKFITAK